MEEKIKTVFDVYGNDYCIEECDDFFEVELLNDREAKSELLAILINAGLKFSVRSTHYETIVFFFNK